MDPYHALDSQAEPSVWDLANQILEDMGDRSAMPRQWLDYLARFHKRYRKGKCEWMSSSGSFSGSTESSGGSLKQYRSQSSGSADEEKARIMPDIME
jgi:hypothetical protein